MLDDSGDHITVATHLSIPELIKRSPYSTKQPLPSPYGQVKKNANYLLQEKEFLRLRLACIFSLCMGMILLIGEEMLH